MTGYRAAIFETILYFMGKSLRILYSQIFLLKHGMYIYLSYEGGVLLWNMQSQIVNFTKATMSRIYEHCKLPNNIKKQSMLTLKRKRAIILVL